MLCIVLRVAGMNAAVQQMQVSNAARRLLLFHRSSRYVSLLVLFCSSLLTSLSAVYASNSLPQYVINDGHVTIKVHNHRNVQLPSSHSQTGTTWSARVKGEELLKQ